MQLSSQLPPAVDPDSASLAFYAHCLRALRESGIRFLVGGAVAMKTHAGVERDTKDVDVFLRREDVEPALSVLAREGYHTEVTFPHWLAKAFWADRFLDLIFNSGNGVSPVDDSWFDGATEVMLLGERVLVCPAEETIWSKSFVMERERYDGADVAHLLFAQSARLDWHRLVTRFGDNYRVLLSHLVLFGFVYPARAKAIPSWVMDELVARVRRESTVDTPVCRGTLLSREQYLADLEQGFRDARLVPNGTMTEEQITTWTAAIARR